MKQMIRNLALASLSLFLVGCGGSGEDKVTLNGTGKAYLKGEQYIRLDIPEEEKGKFSFKEEQKTEYYTLSSSLSGKSVTEVEYEDQYTVVITIDGTVTSLTESSDSLADAITVLPGAFTANYTCTASIKYANESPKVTFSIGSLALNEEETGFSFYVLYVDFPYGLVNQDKCNESNISVTNANIKEIKSSTRSIQLWIMDITATPTITLAKEVSTFDKAITKELNFDHTQLGNVPSLTEDLY